MSYLPCFIISTESSHSLFKSSPLAHVLELGDGGDDDKDDDDDVEGEVEEDTKMQDQGASAAKKASSAQKPPASKPDPTAAITSSWAAASLQSQPKFIWYNLSIQLPVLVSPTGYFRDGQMCICVDFLGIGMDFENNYRVETSGKTLKLFMKIPRRFIDPNRVDAELVGITNNRDAIVSAQREMAGMVYCQHGDDANIWSPPQVMALPFAVEAVCFSSQSEAMVVKIYSPN
jgi:hypothetical protein